ncbi:MAG: MarR family transcriptional regulator [Bacteroidota bacterium]|nr:MarR family transcriptional regulator [Bacteroidota bacterium]
METYSNVKRLIDWAEKFSNQLIDEEQWEDKNFASWLSGEVNASNDGKKDLPENTEPAITMYITFLYKYALFYSRKIFKHSLIYSIEDFGVLATLLPDKRLKKADVIRETISEKSSGNEVLKRLLRQKLIKETNNPNDKRSKLLEITTEGTYEMNALWGQIEKMSSLVTGNLSGQQKMTLLQMLSKLHEFHNPLFEANDEKLLKEKLGIKI